MEKNQPDGSPKALGHHFSDNLRAVLAVAGKQRENGTAGPMTATQIQRETGVARSTLRALKSPCGEAAANPDLETLGRIAYVLGVPPAFLLMRPQDWAELAHAIGSIRDYLEAAAKLERDGQLDFGSPVEKVLRECKVHPDTRPMGVGSTQEVKRVAARDEWRWRACLKLNALMLRTVSAALPRVALASVAGALVSRGTPHDPSISD